MEGVVREDRKMGVLAWFILALMFSPPLQAEEMQSDDNVFRGFNFEVQRLTKSWC